MADQDILIEIKTKEDPNDFVKLAELKNAIIGIKTEQKELETAFKKGAITQKEYAQEVVRVEANHKKLQSSYNELQRSVTGIKTPFQNLTEELSEHAKGVNVAGVSYATFLTPVTAAAAVLGGLGKLYASSTIGSKDLEFATNQLGIAFNLLGNDLATLIGSGEGDGEGFFTKLLNDFSKSGGGFVFSGILGKSKELAMVVEQLQDLERERLKVLADNSERLEQNAVIMGKLADSAVDYNEKVHLAGEAVANLQTNKAELLKVAEAELALLNSQLEADKANEKLQDAVALKEREIAKIKADTERKVQSILKLESNLKDQVEARATAEKKAADAKDRQARNKSVADFNEGLGAMLQGMGKEKEDKDKLAEQNRLATFEHEWAEKVRIAKEGNEEMDRVAQEEFDKDQDRKEKALAMESRFFNIFMNTYRMELAKNEELGKALLKSFLITSLSMIKEQLQFRVFGTEVANKGIPAGLITGAIGAAVIETIYQAAVSSIQGFAQGGRANLVSGRRVRESDGVTISRDNGDNRLVTMRTDEVVLNRQQQSRLGGSAALRAAGVPGFDTGGGFETQSAFSRARSNDGLFTLSNKLEALKVAVVIEDIERLSERRAAILDRATL